MSRESERIFKDFHKYLEGKKLKNEGEVEKSFSEFLQKYNAGLKFPGESVTMSADDYLDLAYDLETEEEALKYAKKALKMDKNCLDAKLLIIGCEENMENAKKQCEKAINEETRRLEEEGLFEADNIGYFYGIVETRPYMRARLAYVELLIAVRKISKAALECEDIIRLNENDNMGLRYRLMVLYAILEDADSAERLYGKFKEERSFSILFPMAVLYYKLDDYKKAESILKKIAGVNKDYIDLLTSKLTVDEDEVSDMFDQGGYQPNTIEEVLFFFHENEVLFDAVVHFNEWASKKYSGTRKKH